MANIKGCFAVVLFSGRNRLINVGPAKGWAANVRPKQPHQIKLSTLTSLLQVSGLVRTEYTERQPKRSSRLYAGLDRSLRA